MDENIISWNVTNWITVLLMAAIGFLVFSTLSQFWQNRKTAAPSGG